MNNPINPIKKGSKEFVKEYNDKLNNQIYFYSIDNYVYVTRAHEVRGLSGVLQEIEITINANPEILNEVCILIIPEEIKTEENIYNCKKEIICTYDFSNYSTYFVLIDELAEYITKHYNLSLDDYKLNLSSECSTIQDNNYISYSDTYHAKIDNFLTSDKIRKINKVTYPTQFYFQKEILTYYSDDKGYTYEKIENSSTLSKFTFIDLVGIKDDVEKN